MRILVLGGTTEARQLAERLAARKSLEVTMSLAGRTTAPAEQPVPVRRGGFGGAAGLASYLHREGIDALVDATHPYAAAISTHAATAARSAGVPLLALRRAPWQAVPGDCWTEVEGVDSAVDRLGGSPRRVFAALGRQEIGAFVRAPQHLYLIRSVDPVDPPLALPHAAYIVARGPFREADERELLLAHRIDVIVAKNSGGGATYGKIAAARGLGLPVILLKRPPVPGDVPAVESVDDVVRWLDHTASLSTERGV